MAIEFQKGIHLRELDDGVIAVGCNIEELKKEFKSGKDFINFLIKKSPKTGKLYAQVRPSGYGDKDV